MDIMELGAIGELVGGVAVIATLIYLAVQLGQTKDMMRMESARSTTKDFSAFMYALMDPGHMELFRRGFDHFESMEPNDQARLHVFLTAIFFAAQSAFSQSERGERTLASEFDEFNAALIRSPGFSLWWKTTKVVFKSEFVEYLDSLAMAQEDAPLVPEFMPWYGWSAPGVDAPSAPAGA